MSFITPSLVTLFPNITTTTVQQHNYSHRSDLTKHVPPVEFELFTKKYLIQESYLGKRSVPSSDMSEPSPLTTEDDTTREILYRKVTQKRTETTITPIVRTENKIELGKRTQKEM